MRLRFFSYVRLAFLALVLTSSLVFTGCNGDGDVVGDDDNVEGIIGEDGVGEDGIGEEGELGDEGEGDGLLDEEEED